MYYRVRKATCTRLSIVAEKQTQDNVIQAVMYAK